ERVQVVLREPLAAAEERQLDDEADSADGATEALDETADRLYGAAGREDVVVDEDLGALRNEIRVEFQRIRPVLELVRGAHGLRGQLPWPPRGDESAPDLT